MSSHGDKDRIDWLERNCVIIAQEPKGADHAGTWAIGPSGNFQIWAERKNSVREAIDHAMQSHP